MGLTEDNKDGNKKFKGMAAKDIAKKMIIIIVCIVFLLLLPDLLILLRELLKKIPYSDIVIRKAILDRDYIQMMTGVLTSCAAICVSVMAYRVVKETGKIQVMQHEQQIVLYAKRLRKNIKRNSLLIFGLKGRLENSRSVQDLVCDDSIEEWIVCLYLSGKFNEEQKKLCESYYEKISCIVKSYAESREDHVIMEMFGKYSNRFFKEDSEQMEFCDEMKEVMDILEHASKGEL